MVVFLFASAMINVFKKFLSVITGFPSTCVRSDKYILPGVGTSKFNSSISASDNRKSDPISSSLSISISALHRDQEHLGF